MAFRHLGGSPKKALPGDILLVIHDFEARSPDELTLTKGEKIELIERDDDFGDGWYLGRHLQEGRTGLFPEVYTTTTPRATHTFHAAQARNPPTASSVTANGTANGMQSIERAAPPSQPVSRWTTLDESSPDVSSPSPLNTSALLQKAMQESSAALAAQAAMGGTMNQRNIATGLHGQPEQQEASPVMNETLSVIDEHITDMHTPRSSLLADEQRDSERSASEYSSHIDPRLSYIAGQETDEEEERDSYRRADVLKWSPEDVARCLKGIGVESRHYDTFLEQEISGEVLLAMDQAAVFMKEFDLGVVGRRLRTWHKIKAWQDELHAREKRQNGTAKGSSMYNSAEDLDSRQVRPGMSAPQPLNVVDAGSPLQNHSQRIPLRSTQSSSSPQISQKQRDDQTSTSPSSARRATPDSPNRPSAASIREFNHSRRHSAADFSSKSFTPSGRNANATPPKWTMTSPPKPSHKKIPSLDRNWTMGGSGRVESPRPPSSKKPGALPAGGDGAVDLNGGFRRIQELERGYTSGGDMDPKKSRNVLRKREAGSANHSRQTSYLEEQRSGTPGSRRHSRLPSVESIRDTMAAIKAPASKLYHANSLKGRQREEAATAPALADAKSANTLASPVVTRLEYDKKPFKHADKGTNASSKMANDEPNSNASARSITSPISPKTSAKPPIGLRAVSDAVTSNEKSVITSPSSVDSSSRDSPVQSPCTGSTTPSAASQSLDLESTDASSKGTAAVQNSISPTVGNVRRKPKRATSAYVRGLEHKTPQEQMIGADYSGWMKKKSSNLMTTWKPRLFVLRGRRLSYYYSENDDCERGLIDISYHRVLAAEKDTMTSFHATITRTKSSPVSPVNAQTLTTASADAAAIAKEPDHPLQKSETDGIFIFKLVPPRAGLSRAVHFTKPTVHYFVVDNLVQGRLWMAALMKAVIDRDDTKPITSSYAHKTISLSKARQLKHRPPALMGLDEKLEGVGETSTGEETGLNILGVDVDEDTDRERAGSLDVDHEGDDEYSPHMHST